MSDSAWSAAQGLSISDEMPKGSFHESVKGFKRELVRSALEVHRGNKLKAAKELGISRCYLHRLLNQLNVEGSAEAEPELQEEVGASQDELDNASMPAMGALRAAARIA